jgi:acyl carrier protein
MKNKIIKIASELFEAEITEDSKMGDVEHWDSLGQLNLFMAIESDLGLSFESDDVIENDSIIKIIELVNKEIK